MYDSYVRKLEKYNNCAISDRWHMEDGCKGTFHKMEIKLMKFFNIVECVFCLQRTLSTNECLERIQTIAHLTSCPACSDTCTLEHIQVAADDAVVVAVFCALIIYTIRRKINTLLSIRSESWKIFAILHKGFHKLFSLHTSHKFC